MPNVVQIDADALLGAINALANIVKSSVVAQPTQVIYESPGRHPIITEIKKRGRPPKEKKPVLVQNEPEAAVVINGESVEDILKIEAPAPQQRRGNPNVISAKRVGQSSIGVKSISKSGISVNELNREQKFIDPYDVGMRMTTEEKDRWIDTEPRPARQKIKLNCCRCNRDFEVYPTELPQGFVEISSPGMPERSKSLVQCNECGVRVTS